MLRHALFALLVTAIWLPGPAAPQQSAPPKAYAARSMTAGSPAVIAAVFSDGSCGPCRKLDPKFESAASAFKAAPIEIVTFKNSFFSRGGEAKEAKRLGITPIYEEYRDRQATVVLIDARKREVIETIKYLYEEEDMRHALREALSRARAS